MVATAERGRKAPQALYRGVSWRKTEGRWRPAYKGKHLGWFKTQEEALTAYIIAGGMPAKRGEAPKLVTKTGIKSIGQGTRRPRKPRAKDTFLPLRMLKDSAREGQWIVWGVGAYGECELVDIDRCTCDAFQKDGHCRHYSFVFATEGQEAA